MTFFFLNNFLKKKTSGTGLQILSIYLTTVSLKYQTRYLHKKGETISPLSPDSLVYSLTCHTGINSLLAR